MDTDQLVAPPTDEAPAATYAQCDQCGEPVDSSQRYCVVCGARRKQVHDPAAQYMAKATARRQPPAAPPPETRRRSPGLGFALILAVIPLAVGLGVLVGRSSTNGDQKLIAALRQQRPEVVASGGGTSAGTTAVSAHRAVPLTSNFPLQVGYAVELRTLPAHGTDQSSVNAAEQAARAKGAKAVGLITQSDFHVTPAPSAGAYVIYSGAYRVKSQAETALAKLHHSFPKAVVISVRSASAAGAGKVLAKTSFGTAHQITGFKATPAQLAQGQQIVNKVAKQIGSSYVNSQKNLPDQISVP